jgi:tetratricopeptide (TPR) repeat protein
MRGDDAPAMKIKLIACLLVSFAFGPSAGRAAPGAMSAGPNDLDRFRHASPPNDSQGPEIAPKFKALLARGEIALRNKRYDEVISLFSAALQSKPPQDAAVLMLRLRSDAYIEKGDLDRALGDANEMVRVDPQHFRGYQVRGRVYRRKGQLDKAIADYTKAARLNPDDPAAYEALAQVNAQTGNFDSAIKFQKQAISTKTVRPPGLDQMKERLRLYEAHKPVRDELELRAPR